MNLSDNLPVIDAVKPQVVDFQKGREVSLEGRNLASGLEVEIGGLHAPLIDARSSLAVVRLPAGLGAGLHSVVASRVFEFGGIKHQLSSDGTAVIAVRPWITPPLYQPAKLNTPASIEVCVVPDIASGQAPNLLLNELRPPDDRPPRAYTLRPDEPAAGEKLSFRASAVEAGNYLARLQVVGIASKLLVDEDPTSPDFGNYVWPKLDVPSGP